MKSNHKTVSMHVSELIHFFNELNVTSVTIILKQSNKC